MASSTTAFPLTGPIRLALRFGYGAITVVAKDDLREARVELTPRKAGTDLLDRVVVEMRGSTLVVQGPRQGGLADMIGGWRRDREAVDALLEVPTGTPVKITAVSEEITVNGRCGDADVAAGSVRLAMDTIAGNLRIRCGKGITRIGSVAGSAALSGGGGTVHFGEVGGSLDCKFGSGELTAGTVRGGLRTRAGSASAQILAAYGDVDLAFGSGPITVGIPAGVAAHIDAITGAGQVHSDLPVEQTAAPDASKIRIRARTGSGDIRLQRAEAA